MTWVSRCRECKRTAQADVLGAPTRPPYVICRGVRWLGAARPRGGLRRDRDLEQTRTRHAPCAAQCGGQRIAVGAPLGRYAVPLGDPRCVQAGEVQAGCAGDAHPRAGAAQRAVAAVVQHHERDRRPGPCRGPQAGEARGRDPPGARRPRRRSAAARSATAGAGWGTRTAAAWEPSRPVPATVRPARRRAGTHPRRPPPAPPPVRGSGRPASSARPRWSRAQSGPGRWVGAWLRTVRVRTPLAERLTDSYVRCPARSLRIARGASGPMPHGRHAGTRLL